MDQRDVLVGFLRGLPSGIPAPLPPTGLPPYAALAEALAGLLAEPPCLISFSGGRDSSALLAIALEVARRQGLPEPVPFTLRFPGAAAADETSWQEAVIDHLKPRQWEIVELPPEDVAFLGPAATASLVAHGLLWPPTLHTSSAWLRRASGATLLTGEGGDELLGPHRATSLSAVLHRLRHQPAALRSGQVRQVLSDASPGSVRVVLELRRMAKGAEFSWLRPPFRDEARREMAEIACAEPWPWPAALRSHARLPARALGLLNQDWYANAFAVRFGHPFLDERVVEAVARHGGLLGYASRTEAMLRLFGDLLPEAVLSRSTKALFNSVYHGEATRAFARAWSGEGVSPDLVDVPALRQIWLADRVDARTSALLQVAWLAVNGATGPAI